MLAEGETNARIAQRLVVSEDTVKSHVKHILRKLGVHNRSQAVSRYFQAQAASENAPFKEERSPVRRMRVKRAHALSADRHRPGICPPRTLTVGGAGAAALDCRADEERARQRRR